MVSRFPSAWKTPGFSEDGLTLSEARHPNCHQSRRLPGRIPSSHEDRSKKLISPTCGSQSLLSCLILCDAMDCGPPGSSVHGILQARILKSCPPPVIFPTRGSVCVSCIVGGFFTYRATQEAPHLPQHLANQAHPPMYTGLFTVTTTAVTLFIEWLKELAL